MLVTIKPIQAITIEIDEEDLPLFNKYQWFVILSGDKLYVATNELGGITFLHRLIANASPGETVDHKDSNSQNLKRDNLRCCTKHQNAANRKVKANKKDTIYKGVYLRIPKPGKGQPKWEAIINHKGKHSLIASFSHTSEGERLAALAYDEVARNIWGEFAYLNFPDESYFDYADTFGKISPINKIITTPIVSKAIKHSKYKGVQLDKHRRSSTKWVARITHKGKRIVIGRFPYTPEGEVLAAQAYDKKAKEIQGESAQLNFS